MYYLYSMNKWIWSWFSYSKPFDPIQCKALSKQVSIRFKLQEDKKSKEIKNIKREILDMVAGEKEGLARLKVEMLLKLSAQLECFPHLENFMELISSHVNLIEISKRCPDELVEPSQSVIFASAWLTEITELKDMSAQIGPKFGKTFVKRAVLNLDGKVDPLIVDKLSKNPSTYDILTYLQRVSPNEARAKELEDLKNKIETNTTPNNTKNTENNNNSKENNTNDTNTNNITKENNNDINNQQGDDKKENVIIIPPSMNEYYTHMPPIVWGATHIYPILSPEKITLPSAPPLHEDEHDKEKNNNDM